MTATSQRRNNSKKLAAATGHTTITPNGTILISVQFGAKTFYWKIVDGIVTRNCDGEVVTAYGMYEHEKQQLVIDANQPAAEAWQTIIHEALHATSIAAGHDMDENVTRMYEVFLCSLLSPFLQGHPLTRAKRAALRGKKIKTRTRPNQK
jgi:hypothetical protein